MPYTPPASRSPASSISQQSTIPSPATSSLKLSPPRSPGPRPNLPRSRSQASRDELTKPILAGGPEGAGIAARASGLVAARQVESLDEAKLSVNTTIRQLMSREGRDERSQNASSVPQDSSDDDYAELERAVRESLQLNGAGSAPKSGLAQQQPLTVNDSDSTDGEAHPSEHPKLSRAARKITHSRSSTEPAIVFSPSPSKRDTPDRQVSSDISEEDEENDGWGLKPPLIRKKSGELVKPAIRPNMRRKHSSMPGTPTYGKKGVHFSDNIKQVRHFLSVDRPMAVSAGGSPVESYEDDTEFPFGRSPSVASTFDLRLHNFPRTTLERQSQNVRLDRLALSADKKVLLGDVVVANLSFHKSVTARFTIDGWKTTSEVVAAYNADARKKPKEQGYDLFSFGVSLSDQTNLDKKTMIMCIRYVVGGQEFWDNNSSQNFQIEFAKKQPPTTHNPNQGQGPQTIPRSRQSSSQHGQLRSKPSLDDDFGNSYDPSPFRFRQPSKNFLPDGPPARRPQPGGQQFGSRYDFGSSLTAALTQAQTQIGDRSGNNARSDNQTQPRTSTVSQRVDPPKNPASSRLSWQGHAPSSSGTECPGADGLLSNKPSVDSRAYQEFVSKFCFVSHPRSQSTISDLLY